MPHYRRKRAPEVAPRKFIFLDIDGVMKTNRHVHEVRDRQENDFDPQAIQALNDLVERSGAVVYISSTWRKIFTRATLRGHLANQGFMGDMQGAIPNKSVNDRCAYNALPKSERIENPRAWLIQEQINKLARRTAVTGAVKFVIIDDNPIYEANKDVGRQFAYLDANFIQVHPYTGLTSEAVERALEILEGGPEGDVREINLPPGHAVSRNGLKFNKGRIA